MFFLDNRTSSGGVSHYSESEPTQLYMEDCVFQDNLARPDDAVSLPRESDGYGHGGAVNMRFSDSSKGQQTESLATMFILCIHPNMRPYPTLYKPR